MEPITLHIKTAAGARHSLTVSSLSETILELKSRLAPLVHIPALAQRVIFRGQILANELTLQDVKDRHSLEDGHTMHVVQLARARQPATEAVPPAGAAAPPSAAPAAAAAPGVNPFAMFGAGGFGGAGGGFGALGGAGGDGMPDMQAMQNQLMQNPEQMQAMLNSPMMDSLMNNPEVARSLMMANPQIRELLEANPEIGHVLNDPGTFRQMLQMARSPALMNEMMRSTDRQLANIESTPGGWNALRRMHENIQQPLMDAAAGAGGGGGGGGGGTQPSPVDENPFAALFNNTPSTAAMPNPWAAHQPAAAPAPQPAAAPPQPAAAPPQLAAFPPPPPTFPPQPAAAPAWTPPPVTQEQMAPQLQQLRDMGFLDTNMCLDALRQARGDVNLAVEVLLSRFGGP